MRDRAVSNTLSYSLTLTMATLLVVGLLTAGSTFVGDQQSHVVRSELEVVGQRLAADVSTADRLVALSDGAGDVNVTSRLPQSVSGASYSIEVRTGGGNASLELRSPAFDGGVAVPLANATAVEATTTSGGDVVVVYDESTGRLEVTNA